MAVLFVLWEFIINADSLKIIKNGQGFTATTLWKLARKVKDPACDKIEKCTPNSLAA
jgi:hypothetical protein